MDLEPVRSSAIATARLGHADREAFLEPTGLAGSSVSLVNHTYVIVLTLWNHSLVVAESSKERLTAFTGESSEVESSSFFITNSAQLVF